jgi:hypothetical protein
MDGSRFDDLVKSWLGGETRRSLLQRVAAVPLVGGLAAFLTDEDDAEAKKKGNKDKNKKKRKKRCKRKKAQACAGQCGTVTVKCKKGKGKKAKSVQIDCGSCACEPACDACFICDEETTTCVVDPEQQGVPCGPGQLCQADGACACSGDSCGVNGDCVDGACVCDGGFELCADGCIDPQTDPDNCGACGNECPATAECVAGACECPAGEKNCNGQCIDQAACCGVCIQLTWTTPNADLDTHVWAPDGTEVWFENFGSLVSPPFIALDIDDTSPPGLEQVSISQLQDGTTSYAVVNFDACTGAGTDFGTSDATVTVTEDGAPLGTFTVATATGSGVWWNVFEINQAGTITIINQLSDTPLETSGQVCDDTLAAERSGKQGKRRARRD